MSGLTPETDTFAAHMSQEFIDPTWLKFSQELERERDEAREKVARLQEIISQCLDCSGILSTAKEAAK